jgi:hypothetical protein
MEIYAVNSSGSPVKFTASQCTFTSDFTTPETKTVTISYMDLTAAFTAWAVGLTGLTVTKPDNLPLSGL